MGTVLQRREKGRIGTQDVMGLTVALKNREIAKKKKYRLKKYIKKWKKRKLGNRETDKVSLE